jgi:hypothetical protein
MRRSASEAGVAFTRQVGEQRMLGVMGLDQHLAGALGAPGAARDLHDKLGHAFAGAEIRAE